MKRKIFFILGAILLLIIIALFALSISSIPDKNLYGVSFNVSYANELLGSNWKDAYIEMLDDLKVKRLRLAAQWSLVEPTKDNYDWSALDFEINEAQKRDAEVILAVGRRLPRWPECHTPDWAAKISWEEQKKEIESYINEVVSRYKDYSNIKYWQVENEPFLKAFAYEQCGDLDVDFFNKEIALVKKLDPTRKIIVTDSGNLGTWYGAYKRSDVFGTSVYVYLSNPITGPIRTFLPPSFYAIKKNFISLFLGNKPIILSELSLEPWLLKSIKDTPIDEQIKLMNIDRFNEVVKYGKGTPFEQQYLWGVEWWYYLKLNDHPEYWDRVKEIFNSSN
ncbi:MAG: endo-1,4-beta-xylanase [Candidatus Paceibacterota bacterium]